MTVRRTDNAPANKSLVAQPINYEWLIVHKDHLDTPRRITNETGDLVWRWQSDAFGNGLPNADYDEDGYTYEFNMRFPGQYYDYESGLHYNWNRYYDPEIGRYITSDPIGLQGGINTYLYSFANPSMYLDFTGLAITGKWLKKPTPQITNTSLRPGATRPPFLEGLDLYPLPHWIPITIPYSVDFIIEWEVECKDSDACTSRQWNIDQTTPTITLNRTYDFQWGFHYYYQGLITLKQMFEMLVIPDAIKEVGNFVDHAFVDITATMMCLANPK